MKWGSLLIISLCFQCVSKRSGNSLPKKSGNICSENLNNEEQLDELVTCLNLLPKSDLSAPAVVDYLSKHKVYVSLTSSPERLKYIPQILRTVDLDLVDTIFLTLPKKFKNKELYPDPLPKEILDFPKVEVLRPDYDYGPISKMLHTIEKVQKMDPKAIVISIDDDTAYPIGLFRDLVIHLILNEDIDVAGGFGQGSSFWNLKPNNISFKDSCDEGKHCDVVEGFATIAYRVGKIPVEKLKAFSQKSMVCRLGDDVVINYALELEGIKRHKAYSNNVSQLVQLFFGFEADALHQQNSYINSYQKCIESIEK